MDKRTVGFAIMFLSLILMIGFSLNRWDYVGDLSLTWPLVWMITAVMGFVLVIWKEKKEK